MVPASHMMLRTIALSDQVSYPWFAPAGIRRGGITNATSAGYLDSTTSEFRPVALTEGQRDALYNVKVNPITFFNGVGLVNYGQKTLSAGASSLDRINVARLVIYLRSQLNKLAKPFVFEPNEQGGTFITHDEAFTSVWYDAREDTVYFTKANDATVYRWDDPAQNPLTMEWKSKTFLLEDYVNFGAARIRADYVQLQNNPASAALLDDNNYTSLMDDDGIIELADDTLPPPPPALDSTITFRMWVNKQLTFTHAVTNDQPFRLPTGYRSDTFEFGVETKLRLRAIHVAETVSGLKAV
jgi:hypothetical protein